MKDEIERIEEQLDYLDEDPDLYQRKSEELSRLEELYEEDFLNLFEPNR